MMNIDVPEIDLDYDYAVELMITGQVKQHVKDAILSITQVNTEPECSKGNILPGGVESPMDENRIEHAMSHLNKEEKRKILDVMKRAKAFENEAPLCARQNSVEYAEQKSRSTSCRSLLDINLPLVCPICVDVEVASESNRTDNVIPYNFKQNICSLCRKTVCKDCGRFEINTKTKFQHWVCLVCSKQNSMTMAYQTPELDKESLHVHSDNQFQQQNKVSSLKRESAPNPMAAAPSTPETSGPQRPNFLSINDAEYFQVSKPKTEVTTRSSSSSVASHERGLQPAVYAVTHKQLPVMSNNDVIDSRPFPLQPKHQTTLEDVAFSTHSSGNLTDQTDLSRLTFDSPSFRMRKFDPIHNNGEESSSWLIDNHYDNSVGHFTPSHLEIEHSDFRGCAVTEGSLLSDGNVSPVAHLSLPLSDLSPIKHAPPTIELDEGVEPTRLTYEKQAEHKNLTTKEHIGRDWDSQTSTIESGYESQSKEARQIEGPAKEVGCISAHFPSSAGRYAPMDYMQTKTTTNIHNSPGKFIDKVQPQISPRENRIKSSRKLSLKEIVGTPAICNRDLLGHKPWTADDEECPIGTKEDERRSMYTYDSCQLSNTCPDLGVDRTSIPTLSNTLSKDEQTDSWHFNTSTHVSSQTEVFVKDREIQVTTAQGNNLIMSAKPSVGASVSMSVSTKPIPAPRRKVDNSFKAKASASNHLESDDDIVEIRFDDEQNLPVLTAIANHANGAKNSNCNNQCQTGKSKKAPLLKSNGRSASVDSDARRANIKRSMDALLRREEDEIEITKDLERQLTEIRRLEERQRSILQSTLRQVVHSVNENQTRNSCNSLSHSQKDEIPMDSKIDYSSLLSPSFNRKTPLNSPLLCPRSAASPQSPRKLSAVRRQDMETINENGGYNISELAAMSPASSHRMPSTLGSPILPSRPDYIYPMSSHSLPLKSERYMLGCNSESLAEKNFRLSSSYTELPPQPGFDDKGGYFSDCEADRRKGRDDLKAYTDEARRALLQFEIEKRRKQVDENNVLRTELQRLIQSGSIPAAKYDKLREMYRDHINRSREYLGLSSSSLNSLSTGRGIRMDGYNTDSDIMSSTEQLAETASHRSSNEQFMQSSNYSQHKNALPISQYCEDVPCQHDTAVKIMDYHSGSASLPHSCPGIFNRIPQRDENLSAMPLLDIRAPKSSASRFNSSSELSQIGDISRAASEASFGDPEERIIDAKLEGGKTIQKSKENDSILKNTGETMRSGFNFPTKKILITPGSYSKERGLGLIIKGGQPVSSENSVTGAFVEEIRAGSVAAQLLGELKIGDEIVEWNGVCLRNKKDVLVQDMISHWSGEIEVTVRLDKPPYTLPRHQTTSPEHQLPSQDDFQGKIIQDNTRNFLSPAPPLHRRLSCDAVYQSSENIGGSFESPMSDKSWSKEFDPSRRNGRQKSFTHIPHSEHESEVNEHSWRTVNYNCDGKSTEVETRKKQIEEALKDMDERLSTVDRADHSLQSEYQQEKHHHPLPVSISPALENKSYRFESQDSSANLFHKAQHAGDTTVQQQRGLSPPETRKQMDVPLPLGLVTRSRSDISSTVQSDSNDANTTSSRIVRRMSHQEKLSHPSHPLSPGPGRRNNIPRLKDCGQLEAMFMYDYKRCMLVVRIERAIDLAIAGQKKLNPFIKVHFMKYNKVIQKRCTRYIEGKSSPRWEQSFTFSVQSDDLNMHKIKMAAWDYFQPRQNMFIGAATIDLSKEQHVDGNLRLYRLDSELGERRESIQGRPCSTLSRVSKSGRSRQQCSLPPALPQKESCGVSTFKSSRGRAGNPQLHSSRRHAYKDGDAHAQYKSTNATPNQYCQLVAHQNDRSDTQRTSNNSHLAYETEIK